ncbi:MAG: hypothetical protein JJU32_18295 [Phormidium sp. BM_Day4_Bin.17]|nr:hypothetical protein [Phormidium sp. BM_Day4_Bin.17]UCJ13994.1 MAG: hypothetical protein JWS08_09875 [Phormidium sp. PBR-2020]
MDLNQFWNVVWGEGTLFHYTIAVLFGVTILGEIFYWIRSRSKLQASQSKIRELEKFSKQAMDAQDSQYRIPRNSNNFRWFTHHLGGEWIENYFCAKLEHGDFVLLQYPAALSRSAASSPFRFIPGILIAIGVLGTFYGIQEGLTDLSLADIGGDSQQLLSSSVTLLEGMKTAFSTSLMGLSSSSLLTFVLFLSQVVRRQHISQLRHRLDRIAFLESPEHLLSKLNLDSNAEAAVSLKEAAENIRELSPQAIGSAVGESMRPIFTDINSSLLALREEISQDREELLNTLIQEQRTQLIQPILEELNRTSNLTETTSRLIQETSQAINGLTNELAGVTRSLSGAIETIQEFQQQTLTELNQFAKNLQTILSDFQTGTRDVMEEISDKITQGVDASIKAMEGQKEAFEESAKQAASTFVEIREQLETALTTQGQEQRRLLSDFTETMEQTVSNQAQLLSETGDQAKSVMEQASSNLTDTLGTAASTFVEIREQLETALTTQGQEQRRLLSDFTETMEQTVSNQAQLLSETGDQAKSVMEQASSNLTDTLGNIDETLQNTRITVQEELEQFRQQYQEALMHFFEDQDKILEETLGKQRDGLIQMLDKTDAVFVQEYERRKELGEQVDGQIQQVTHFVSSVGLTSGERLAQLQEITQSLGGEADKIDQSYANLIQRLNQALDQSNRHLEQELRQSRESSIQFFQAADSATAELSKRLLTAANYLVSASAAQQKGY